MPLVVLGEDEKSREISMQAAGGMKWESITTASLIKEH